MNVYDFDKTIYNGDSTIDFYLYCLKKHPCIIMCIPKQGHAALKYILGKINKTQFKEVFFCFVQKLDNIDSDIVDFWNKNEKKIKKWYRNQYKESDLIISASPYFILNEICIRLELKNLIASKVDKFSGKYIGENCYGEEKVRRYRELFDDEIDQFYSDSKSDQPLADISIEKFIVRGDRISKW